MRGDSSDPRIKGNKIFKKEELINTVMLWENEVRYEHKVLSFQLGSP